MKIAFFDSHKFENKYYTKNLNSQKHQITFFETRLTEKTAHLVNDFDVVCCFVNDKLNAHVIEKISKSGVKLLALRCAGFNNVDLVSAKKWGLKVVRVPEYSPYAVAEHAVALLLTVNRKIHKAYNRVREGNFSLDGLVGFDLHRKTVGLVGAGKIGSAFAKIMFGFGCKVQIYDLVQNPDLINSGAVYVSLDQLLSTSDIISLHVPLNDKTKHLLNTDAFNQMKSGVVIINTGRGALIDTKALIQNLKNGKVGFAGLDVYEEEAGVFYENHSDEVLSDDVLIRLMTFPNVILTSHQGFLTEEALQNIADATFESINAFESGADLRFEVKC